MREKGGLIKTPLDQSARMQGNGANNIAFIDQATPCTVHPARERRRAISLIGMLVAKDHVAAGIIIFEHGAGFRKGGGSLNAGATDDGIAPIEIEREAANFAERLRKIGHLRPAIGA